MSENTKVVIQVEYECDGLRRVCYGEIDEIKLEKLKKNFYVGEENYILMENDGKFPYVDKESVISIEKLCVESTVFEKPQNNDCSQSNNNSKARIGS